MKIDAGIANPFAEAAIKVIKNLTGLDVRKGGLSHRVTSSPSYDVSIIVGLYGFLSGQVMYSMSKEVAARLGEKILKDKSPDKLKELLVDTLGELANMITGNAAGVLSRDKNSPLKLTTPAIVTGSQFNVKFAVSHTAVFGMITPYGPLEISLALELVEPPK
ncbi:MAG: chemotaxis protein CheX [Spirochaetaceae bacterium]|nr:MAG: chemotaxis protein CheX [Spirochaetaceae bacterium]